MNKRDKIFVKNIFQGTCYMAAAVSEGCIRIISSGYYYPEKENKEPLDPNKRLFVTLFIAPPSFNQGIVCVNFNGSYAVWNNEGEEYVDILRKTDHLGKKRISEALELYQKFESQVNFHSSLSQQNS